MTSLIEKVVEAQRNVRDEYVELTQHGLSHEVEARAAIQVVLREMYSYCDEWSDNNGKGSDVYFFVSDFRKHHNIDLTEPKP